jgi:hypothetical protein
MTRQSDVSVASLQLAPAVGDPKLLELTCVPEASDLIERKLGALADALARIAWRPLTPRLVGAALGISGQERLRWTKDGRLPRSGQVAARRGNPLSVPTYSVEAIEKLARHPGIVTAWREQDTAARGRSSYKNILISHLTVGTRRGDTWAVEVPRVELCRGAKREAGVKPELPPQL